MVIPVVWNIYSISGWMEFIVISFSKTFQREFMSQHRPYIVLNGLIGFHKKVVYFNPL